MEQKSKLLDIYKISPFSNIGSKVSAIQKPQIPDDIKVGEYNTKSILEIQKDFDEIVVKPYGTVLSELSKIGNIKVNPTTSVLRLFSQLNDNVSAIIISNETNLLSVTSIYSHIKEPSSADLLKYKILPSIEQPIKTSLLNENIPSIQQFTINNNLIYSDTQKVNEFNTLSILNLDSKFDDIVELKINSVLDKNIPFEAVTDLPYSDVLDLNSQFDDLVIKDIGSILKVYVASNLPGTVPGVVNFFTDIYNTGFTPNAQQGQSLFNQDAIPEHRDAKINPNKSGIDIVPMSTTPEKNIIDTRLMSQTPEKVGLDVSPLPEGPKKTTLDVSPLPEGPKKTTLDVSPLPEGPQKIGLDVSPSPEGPQKIGLDVNKMPDTIEKTISDINPPAVTPEKLASQLIPLAITPVKEGLDVDLMPNTPDKKSLLNSITSDDIIPMPNTPDKKSSLNNITSDDIILMPNTPDKKSLLNNITSDDIIPMPDIPDKIQFISNDDGFPNRYYLGNVVGHNPNTGIVNFIPDDKAYGFTPNALRLVTQFILDDKEIPVGSRPLFFKDTIPSDWGQLSTVNFITDEKAYGFTLGAQRLITQFKLPRIPGLPDSRNMILVDVPSEFAQLGATNFFQDDKATGFTLGAGKLITEYNTDVLLEEYDDTNKGKKELQAFNWNIPPGYPGVLNQYAVYFSKYPPLTNVTYKTVIDWAYNQIVRVPEAQALYSEGFHTPKINVSEFQLITPPYQYANDRLPTWANTYVSTLEGVGSTLVAGFLTQKTIDLLGTITGLDTSPMKQSSLAFHQLAGEIYWENNKLGTAIRNVREGVLNFVSDLVGNTLANVFIPTLENAIGGATADLVNSMVNAPLLDSDKVLMLYHIMMGTKYTKSKAFFDRLTKTYSSKYGQIGDNALNLYNDVTFYSKYVQGDSVNAFGYAIPYVPTQITDIFLGSEKQGTIKSDDSVSQLKSTLSRVLNGYSQTMKIPIGNYEPGLINKYLRKNESKTFGTIIDPIKYYSVDSAPERNIYKYDGPSLANSIDTNHPTPEDIAKSPALGIKSDLNALANNSISDYTDILSSDLSLAYRHVVPDRIKNEGSYYIQMVNKLKQEGKLLDEKGFPSIATQFSDAKNRLNMIKMPASQENLLGITPYVDNDLIDFFFEDLSSYSDKHQSVVIPFRAILTTVSDGTNANWAAQDYMGRADKFWIYQGFERRVAVAFDVAINSKDEFISSWNKINYLHGMCYPVAYPAEIALKAPIMALTIGNLFNRIQVILNSFNVSFDGASLWEIEKGYQLPMYIKIQTDFTVIFDDIPLAASKHYGQNQEWIKPKIYDYSPEKTQNDGDLNKLSTLKDGTLSTAKSNSSIAVAQNLDPVNQFGGGYSQFF